MAELLFMHGGHRAKVNDFGWNTKDHLVLASVEENNILQVWQMVRTIIFNLFIFIFCLGEKYLR